MWGEQGKASGCVAVQIHQPSTSMGCKETSEATATVHKAQQGVKDLRKGLQRTHEWLTCCIGRHHSLDDNSHVRRDQLASLPLIPYGRE